ncbi:MAG: cache domain-containing protein, partial [Gammaproteobacteria bacterium]
MIVIQISSLYFVDLANTRNAMFLVGESLIATTSSFNNQIVTRNDALSQAGRLLSGDFAFKTAYASTSSATIRSALDNHRQRIGADLMLLLSLQGETIASSGRAAGNFSEADGMFALPDFVEAAITEGGAAGMVSRNNAVYSVIAVPLLTPVPSAWIILGFEVNDSLINKLQEDSHADISIAAITGDHWNINISTLEPAIQTSLTTALNRMPTVTETTIDLNLDGTHWFTFISQLPSWGETPLYAVLQRSGNEALAPYYRIRLVLIGLLIAALIISIVAGGAIASSVTRPVQMLVSYAR